MKKWLFLKIDLEIIEKIKEDNLDNKLKKLFKSMVDEVGGLFYLLLVVLELCNL